MPRLLSFAQQPKVLSFPSFKLLIRRHVWFLSSILLLPSVACRSCTPTPAFLVSFPRHHRHHRSLSSLMSLKRDSPSAQRNKDVILDVLTQTALPKLRTPTPQEPLRILEVAAGSGVHTEHFVSQLGSLPLQWFATDPTTDSLASIDAYIQDGSLSQQGAQEPLPLTLNQDGIMEASTVATLFQGSKRLDMILCINMIHISPWTATLGLMRLAKEHLAEDGVLYCYGPYKEGGTAVESNLNFDRSLQSRDPAWGVRNLEDVRDAAAKEGLTLSERVEMPANNLSLIFVRSSSSS